LFYSLATYGNAGYMREQVCKYMCPYARFQGAMFDRNTLIISYDEQRGEPRGHRKRNVPSVLALAQGEQAPLGDCIDCLACVQVCPTGIDIRNGLQVGCIACAACIDACDMIMDRMDYPRGLIRYTTENTLEGRPSRILRPRTLIYAGVLAVLAGAFVWSIVHRSMLLAEVLRDRNTLWRPGPAGSIENSYTLKLVNKSNRPLDLVLGVDGRTPVAIIEPRTVTIPAEQVAAFPVTLRAPAGSLHGRHDVTLRLDPAHTPDPKPLATVTTAFFAPMESR
jgi:cytochrome c oxidase accessory protein FixG